MTLEQLVTDLATSQRLRDAGFPQDTAMVWADNLQYVPDVRVTEPPVLMSSESAETIKEMCKRQIELGTESFDIRCAAPTAEEILKELPPYLQGSCCQLDLDVLHLSSYGIDGKPAPLIWIVQWCCPEIDEVVGRQESQDSLVLAAAQAYLWWKKEVAG